MSHTEIVTNIPAKQREMWMCMKVEPALDVTDATKVVGDKKHVEICDSQQVR